jgi:hypothetical protein
VAEPPIATVARPAEKRAGFVLIGCKAPNGLILNLDRYEKRGDQGQVKRIPGAATVTLKGWARKAAEPDLTEGGYMLTAVPVDFWREWIARNEDSSLILDKIILPPHQDAAGQAREHKAIPQMFRPAHPGDKSEDRYVPGVEIGERATP